MRRLLYLLVVAGAASLWSAGAVAQTKVTGTHVCSKPDPQHMVPVGDRADHNFAVEQLKCNHTKPMEIGGDKARTGWRRMPPKSTVTSRDSTVCTS